MAKFSFHRQTFIIVFKNFVGCISNYTEKINYFRVKLGHFFAKQYMRLHLEFATAARLLWGGVGLGCHEKVQRSASNAVNLGPLSLETEADSQAIEIQRSPEH